MSDTRPIGMGEKPLGAIEASAGGTVASGHEATGRNLHERRVTVERNMVLEEPPKKLFLKGRHDAFWKVMDSISGRNDREVPYDTYCDMVGALYQPYPRGSGRDEGETAFDRKLFDRFRIYLGDMVGTATSRDIIVLKGSEWVVGDGTTYAIGFSRQVTSEKLCIPLNFGCAKSSRHDHSCVLLTKGQTDGAFSVIETSANIELKTKPNSCRLEKMVQITSSMPNEYMMPDLCGRDGALGQSIAYTLSDVWTCLARKGMTTETGETPQSVPFGLIACGLEPKKPKQKQKKKKNPSTRDTKKMKKDLNETRWALGNVNIPDACGGLFKYQIKSFGSFEESKASHALAAYLSVMTEGIKFLMSLRERQTFEPYPLSGRQLKFGAQSLEQLQYRKSPFTERKWGAVISQGEFWDGSMSRQDLRTLLNELGDDDDFVVFQDDQSSHDELRALVKVSSRPVFNTLVLPQDAFKALRKIKKYQARIQQTLAISRVLVAVWNQDENGLVAIMHDISTTHSDLRPGNLLESDSSSVSLAQLWAHFQELVREQLIPLASAGIIHPDIRAGYDWTANIMARTDGSDMLLIDFESLVLASAHNFSGSDKHGRYLSVPSRGNAFSFVCLQCIVVAVAWSQGHKHVEADKSKQPVVWSKFGTRGKLGQRTSSDVEMLLEAIGSQFRETGFTKLDEGRIAESLGLAVDS